MPISRWLLAAAAAALTFACAVMRVPERGAPKRGIPIFQADSITYDGSELNVRVLVGARDGAIMLDRRFPEGFIVDVRDVWDCASGAPIGYIIEDVFWPKPTGRDLIELAPGQWVGADQNFWLFHSEESGPDCIKVELVLLLQPMPPGGYPTLVVEARRTFPPEQPDGGAPPGNSDAGLPPTPPYPDPDRPDGG